LRELMDKDKTIRHLHEEIKKKLKKF